MKKSRKLFGKIIKVLFWILFLVVFIASSVAVIFYASGYKYNIKTGKVEKTGILMVNHKENGLSFFIDGKSIKLNRKKSPADLFQVHYTLSMSPGEYDFEIRKGGYKNYQRKIRIEKELVTKIDDIIFIPERITRNNLDIGEDISSYVLSPNKKLVLAHSLKNGLFVFNLENSDVKRISQETQEVASVVWRSDNESILVKNKSEKGYDYRIINIHNETDIKIKDQFSFFPFFDDIFFSPQTSGELFGISQEILYKINLTTKEISEIRKGVSNYHQSDRYIYYNEEKTGNLFQLDMETIRDRVLIENYTPPEGYRVFSLGEREVFFLSERSLFRVKDKNNLEVVEKEIDFIEKKNDGRGLLAIKNSSEVVIIDNKGEKALVSRFGQRIIKAEEYLNDKNIIYLSEDGIGLVNTSGASNQTIEQKKYSGFSIAADNKILAQEGSSLYHFKTEKD